MSTFSKDSRSSNGDALTSTEVAPPQLVDPGQLIENHQTGIWRYLRALGCDANEAEDLTQETFLAVLQKPFQYYSKAAASSYLRKVAYHRFISARRRQGKEVVVAELEQIDENWSRWIGQDDGDELLHALQGCLRQLTDRARWALQLRFRDRLSRANIAAALSITEHGAKNLMQRAKKKLKACIEGKMS